MPDRTDISFYNPRFAELQRLLKKLAPHEHTDGINECHICAQPLDEAILIELRRLVKLVSLSPPESKWIEFVCIDRIQGHKTFTWRVVTKDGPSLLGDVKWYGPWRCYSFFPRPDCIFEKQCLRDIASFCEQQTQAHKTKS